MLSRAEEKPTIMHDRAAQRATVILSVVSGFGIGRAGVASPRIAITTSCLDRIRGKEIGRFQMSITCNEKFSSVKTIGAAFGYDFNDGATRFARVGAEIIGIDCKFLNAFRSVVLLK